MDDRIWDRRIGHGRFQQTYDDGVATGSGFCLYPVLNTSGKNQQAALSTRMLKRYAHKRINQFLRYNLARYCLRDFHNGSEIQVLDRCPDCGRRREDWFCLPEVRI
jgi:hypothetical protein